MFGQPDILTYLRAEAITVMGSELARQIPAKFEQVFETRDDARERIEFGQLHRAGSMKPFGQGTPRPRTQPFIGGMTTLSADQFGEEIAWLITTMDEARAKGLELRSLIEGPGGWVASWMTGRDKLACNVLKNGTSGTGYDGKALFATDHPQRSAFGDGTAISNLDTSAEGITASVVKVVHEAFSETMAIAENGEQIDNSPSHILVTRVRDFHEMSAVLFSEKLAGVANNDNNTLREIGFALQHWPRLKQSSGTQYWYMVKANAGLLFRDKERLSMDSWYKPEDRTYHVGPAYQAVAGYQDFRAAYRKAIA